MRFAQARLMCCQSSASTVYGWAGSRSGMSCSLYDMYHRAHAVRPRIGPSGSRVGTSPATLTRRPILLSLAAVNFSD